MSQWGINDYANNAPKYLNTNHPGNTNVFLVGASRMANATFGSGKAVAHQGWVKVIPGVGHVQSISVSNVASHVYSNTFLSIVGANTTPANARMVVTGTNNITVVVNSTGSGYTALPTITAEGANNTSLIFTAVGGGRLGRVQAETLVAISSPNITDANSGLPYFTGA